MEQTQPVQNMTNEPIGFPGAPTPTQPQKKNWKWLIILILFLVVIGGVTFFVFKSSKTSSTDQNQTPEPTSGLTNVATSEPTPASTTAPVDKTKLNISVLNGTGTPGDAGLLSDQLKKLGYTNITTGNASSQNATDTQVTFGSGVSQDVISEITGSLQSTYTSVTTSNTSLPAGTDIQITTGTVKGRTTAPAATTAPTATATSTPSPTPASTPK